MDEKIGHFGRMNQRLGLLKNKPKGREDTFDFIENMVGEHALFYTRQGLTKDEAYKAMRIPNGLKDEIGIKNMLEIIELFNRGKIHECIDILIKKFSSRENETQIGYDISNLCNDLREFLNNQNVIKVKKGRFNQIISGFKIIVEAICKSSEEKNKMLKLLKDLYIFYGHKDEEYINFKDVALKLQEESKQF